MLLIGELSLVILNMELSDFGILNIKLESGDCLLFIVYNKSIL